MIQWSFSDWCFVFFGSLWYNSNLYNYDSICLWSSLNLCNHSLGICDPLWTFVVVWKCFCDHPPTTVAANEPLWCFARKLFKCHVYHKYTTIELGVSFGQANCWEQFQVYPFQPHRCFFCIFNCHINNWCLRLWQWFLKGWMRFFYQKNLIFFCHIWFLKNDLLFVLKMFWMCGLSSLLSL